MPQILGRGQPLAALTLAEFQTRIALVAGALHAASQDAADLWKLDNTQFEDARGEILRALLDGSAELFQLAQKLKGEV